MRKQMVTLYEIDTLLIGGHKLKTKRKIRQFYEFSNVFVVRLDESDGNPNKEKVLLAYGYADENFNIKWEFPFDDVVGISPEFPEMKKESEFITPDHYNQFIEKFKGKELLIVYAGNFRFRVDANTGEIYDKIESR